MTIYGKRFWQLASMPVTFAAILAGRRTHEVIHRHLDTFGKEMRAGDRVEFLEYSSRGSLTGRGVTKTVTTVQILDGSDYYVITFEDVEPNRVLLRRPTSPGPSVERGAAVAYWIGQQIKVKALRFDCARYEYSVHDDYFDCAALAIEAAHLIQKAEQEHLRHRIELELQALIDGEAFARVTWDDEGNIVSYKIERPQAQRTYRNLPPCPACGRSKNYDVRFPLYDHARIQCTCGYNANGVTLDHAVDFWCRESDYAQLRAEERARQQLLNEARYLFERRMMESICVSLAYPGMRITSA